LLAAYAAFSSHKLHALLHLLLNCGFLIEHSDFTGGIQAREQAASVAVFLHFAAHLDRPLSADGDGGGLQISVVFKFNVLLNDMF